MARLGLALSACVLLMCARQATRVAGFGVLSLHDFDCSQPGVKCTAKEVVVPPISWFEGITWNPMPPQSMSARPALLTDPGCHNPQAVLNISWQVATDASILHLEGAEVCVLRYQGSHSVCVRYAFSPFTSSRSPSGHPWEFFFDRFEAEPSMHYLVYIYNLPMVMAGHDDLHIKAEVDMPDCRNQDMMLTRNCIITGSLWQPRVVTSFYDNKLVVNFTTSNISSEKYHVIVQPERGCGVHRRLERRVNSTKEDQRSVVSDLDMGLQECSILSVKTTEDRKSVMFELDMGLQDCDNFSVEIIPFFEACKNDCTRKLVNVTRQSSECAQGLIHEPKCGGPGPLQIIILAGVAALLLSLLLITVIFLRMRRTKRDHEPVILLPREEPEEEPTVDKRKSVLLLYSSDHPLYDDVICCLASYLQNHCGFEVFLDQFERQPISLTGPMAWLQAHKTKVEMDPGSKIMVVCSRGAMVKWRRSVGQERETSGRRDGGVIGDMFTPALGLIANDFKDPVAARNTYIIAYFEDFDSKETVPEVLRMAQQYGLMTNMPDVWFRICGREQRGPVADYRVGGISADDYHSTVTGKRLYEAIGKFKTFQKSNPTWFEHLDESPAESVACEADGVKRHGVAQLCLQVNHPELGSYESEVNAAILQHVVQNHLANPPSPNSGVIHSHPRQPPAPAQSDDVSRPFVGQWPADGGHRSNDSDWQHQHVPASNRGSCLEARPRSEGYHSSSSETGHCSTPLAADASLNSPAPERADSRRSLRELDETATLMGHAGRKVERPPPVDNADSGIGDGPSGHVEPSDVSHSTMKLLYEFQLMTITEHLNDRRRPELGGHLGPALPDGLASETVL